MKFFTDHDLPLNKQLNLQMLVIIIRSVLYESYVCNAWCDLMQKAMSFNDAAILYVKGSACKIHFWYMSKDDAISIINNSNLIDKEGVL